MAFRKFVPSGDTSSACVKALSFTSKMNGDAPVAEPGSTHDLDPDVDIDLREVYFLIMHFLSAGPCQRTFTQFWNELLEHKLLPRRYHAWYSRSGVHSGDENDDGMSFPLNYNMLVQRFSHVEKDHLLKLLRQLILSTAPRQRCMLGGSAPNAADVPTLMGTGSFSLLRYDHRDTGSNEAKHPPAYMRWPHMRADQIRGLSLREIGGGFTRHHRAPSIRAACYAIAKPSVMADRMQNMKKLRGHRNAVYCATFDCSGRYVITGSDDRLVKIWSMETSYCLASCRGHDGDITDLAVSSNNAVVASSSNDCVIRVWRLPDGFPISTLRGHTGAVTAIVFNPRPNSIYHLLSSSDDGTCRIWDARYSNLNPRIYTPKRPDSFAGNGGGPSTSTGAQSHQIFCCAFNANGTVFVTGSSDTLARVWTAAKPSPDDSERPTHEIDILSGHENDVNYVQFSGCAVTSKYTSADTLKEDNMPKFRNTWFTHDNIVTCSRDGSAIIWIPRSRRSHGRAGRWMRAYHLKVPPPPMPPQPLREGPRQRILPTPRGVNMVIWSLDNRFVLAAIMDCRICVWNASDGSLVHSLTGHTESTYVLDVHPFNPRIAMSAGYDGKIIVWDIWEGKPIWMHEISRFKLVDGKFSPDGTSVILSDDVGQLYVISTGQGEYQMDAKYDQFFLGDYRPLAHDSSGGLIDQETQISPYRRNLQDLLCDSGMIPYPEPYQSAYQRRRLGALGIEWRPTNLRFATGPDFSFDPYNQILPLTDLDVLIEPLPEFIDIMDWEPENEILSDDTDSEYNVTEDYSTGGEQGNLSYNSSVDPECSSEYSGIDSEMDGFRRSNRTKQKADIEIMTSSGRRVKRRNLDDSDGNTVRSTKIKKSKNGRKGLKRKSSKSKSFRPQRAAARNALTLFSKITRTSNMEDDNVSEGEPESESTQPDSIMDSDGSDKHFQKELKKHIKGKEISLDESENIANPHAFDTNAGNKKSLILKLPRRDSNKHVDRVSTMLRCDSQAELVGPSEVNLEACEGNVNHVGFKDPKCSHEDPKWNVVDGRRGVPLDMVHDHFIDGKIKWGMVRARSSKRQKLVEIKPFDTSAGTSNLNCCHEKENDVVPPVKLPEEDSGVRTSGLETKMCGVKEDGDAITNGQDMRRSTSDDFGAAANSTDHLIFTEFDNEDQSSEPIQVVNLEATASFIHNGDRTDLLPDLNENIPSTSTKLRFERISKDPDSIGKEELKSSVDNLDDGRSDSLNGNHSKKEQDSVVPEDDTCSEMNLDHKADAPLESGLQHENNLFPTVEGSGRLLSRENKMYSVVYRRSRSHRGSNNLGVGTDGKGRSTADLSNNVGSAGVDFHEDSSVGACRTRSMVSKVSFHSPNNVSDDPKLSKFRSNQNSTLNRQLLLHEECETSSRVPVGLRSNRTRRGSPYVSDTGSIDRRKPHKSSKRRTWLMLTTHEEGYRYIPQLGDEVVYLRQGHQEYLEFNGLKDDTPWASIKGSIRAVEFCKVKTLEYSSLPGSGDSCCKMTLQFVDPDSDVFGQSFKLTLPEVTNFPDFLVEKTRYDAVIRRNWTKRDKCKVWWNDGETDGSWWDGRIIHVKPKSLEFPDSPWEMYTIQYKSDPPETHLHSPWELFDVNTQWEQPHIADESKNKLHSAFAKLEQSGNTAQDRFGVQKLKQLSQKPQYMNRFPVPLSLDVIESRLEKNYYRSLRALKHDFMVMLSNAETYLANNSEFLQRLKRLSDWFTKQFPSL